MEPEPEDQHRQRLSPGDRASEPPPAARSPRLTSLLVYLGLRNQDGRALEPRRPSWRYMILYSIAWGLIFPLLDGHPRGYARDVVIDSLIMLVVTVVLYSGIDWRRRRSRSS